MIITIYSITACFQLFCAVSFLNAYEVYVPNTDLLFSSGAGVRVEWSPESVLPLETPNNYEVDIDLIELDTATGQWNKLASLGTRLPNNGDADVHIPNIHIENTLQRSVSAVVVQVSLNTTSIDVANSGSDFLARLGQNNLKTTINSPVRFLKKFEDQEVQRRLCGEWSRLQSQTSIDTAVTQIPRCPVKIENARAPNSGFKVEKILSFIPIVGRIRHFDNTLVDDVYQQYFHPKTTTCFRQRLPLRYAAMSLGYTVCDITVVFLHITQVQSTMLL